jgi:hypothetical protein
VFMTPDQKYSNLSQHKGFFVCTVRVGTSAQGVPVTARFVAA